MLIHILMLFPALSTRVLLRLRSISSIGRFRGHHSPSFCSLRLDVLRRESPFKLPPPTLQSRKIPARPSAKQS